MYVPPGARFAPSEMVRDTNDAKGYTVVRKLDVGIRHMLEPHTDLVGTTLAKAKTGAKELSELERDAKLLFLLQPRMRQEVDADPDVDEWGVPFLGPLETRGWRHANSSKALVASLIRPATLEIHYVQFNVAGNAPRIPVDQR